MSLLLRAPKSITTTAKGFRLGGGPVSALSRLSAAGFASQGGPASSGSGSGCPFSKKSQEMVEATVPILEKGGEVLTRAFYKRMFANDPQVKAYVNPIHQITGAQPRALADSVLAFAKNLNNLETLTPALELIAQKHVALNIHREHYPIVGRNLLAAMHGREKTATKEVIDGWTEAYGVLADVLASREEKIYKQLADQPGGWNGKREFVVTRKVRKSNFITSLSMKPKDGGPLPTHKAGQYLTIHANEKTMPDQVPRPIAPRNYSISSPPGSNEWRITVKRETDAAREHLWETG